MKLVLKTLIIISIVSLMLGCSYQNNAKQQEDSVQELNQQEEDSVQELNQQEEDLVQELNQQEETSVEEDLASRFTTDATTGYGKELEDSWKFDKDNEQLSAMYHYYNALFYDSLDDVDNAKNEMSNIKSNYDGVLSDEIIQYGINLFATTDEWNKYSGIKDEHKANISDSKRKDIKDWINSRYEYYDKIEGSYAGDKYTKTIFQEAADEFGFTYEEINNIWSDLPL